MPVDQAAAIPAEGGPADKGAAQAGDRTVTAGYTYPGVGSVSQVTGEVSTTPGGATEAR